MAKRLKGLNVHLATCYSLLNTKIVNGSKKLNSYQLLI